MVSHILFNLLGTGTIWEGVYKLINPENIRLKSNVTGVNADSKVVHLADGTEISYDFLISTMPLDTMCKSIEGGQFQGYSNLADKFVYSSTNVIGLGMEGK